MFICWLNANAGTQSENQSHSRFTFRAATAGLSRQSSCIAGNFKPAGEPSENKVHKVLADGTTKIYVYDRRTRRLLRSWSENPSATKSANRVQTGSAAPIGSKRKARMP